MPVSVWDEPVNTLLICKNKLYKNIKAGIGKKHKNKF